MVARVHGVNPNQLFHWRKLYQDGSLSAVSAGEEVVPASELADALKQIKELQRLLGKKTMEAEILREAVEYGRAKNVWSAPARRQQVAYASAGPLGAAGVRADLCRTIGTALRVEAC